MTNIFKTMVELQHKFNEQTIKNYLSKNLNWNSAIIAESGELLGSLGYKWWKKQVPDMDNVKVEAIDLLHFVISDAIQLFYNYSGEIDLNLIAGTFEDHFNNSDGYLDGLSLNKLVDELNYNRWNRFIIMKKIFKDLNMSNEDVYIAYIVKNCLNKFRQDNGYKDGSYIKDWNGREDNVVAYEIANEWGADEELFEQLYLDLTTYYNEEVLKNKTKSVIDNLDYFKTQTVN
jgi:dimeric dUTPase (all-alpha-NTP-PPase superfamily)